MTARSNTARSNPWLVLVLVCLAQFMVVLDATIVVGGALGLALLSTFAANKTADVLAPVGDNPTQAQTAQALVDGFHVAWLGCAVFLAAGAALLLALLRPGDVLAVAGGEAAPVVT